MKNSKITVRLVKSTIGLTVRQRANVVGLGLRKIGSSKTLPNIPAVRGMIKKVIHLVEIENN